MSNIYELAGEVFTTDKSVKDRVREILYAYRPGQRLNDADALFMGDLFTYHKSYRQKRGTGIDAIYVRKNAPYNTMGFWLRRLDGTETDISFLECLKPSDRYKKFNRACRGAVAPFISAFKYHAFDSAYSDTIHCPYTGEPLSYETAHVHHRGETFQQILASFIVLYDVNIDAVVVLGEGIDGNMRDTLADKWLEDAWIDYHNGLADLEIVSRTANLSLLRKGGRQ